MKTNLPSKLAMKGHPVECRLPAVNQPISNQGLEVTTNQIPPRHQLRQVAELKLIGAATTKANAIVPNLFLGGFMILTASKHLSARRV